MFRFFLIILLFGLGTAPLSFASWPQRLEQQREVFRQAWPKALDGDEKPIRKNQLLLADYPLYPDLQAAWLKARIGKLPDSEISKFIQDHHASSAVRDLRYRWAVSLAKRGQWQDFLNLFQDNYASSSDSMLQCYALRARLAANNDATLAADALAYWLHGESRPDQCDPVFDWLEHNNLISADHRRQRIALALEQREFALAAWLARALGPADREHVQKWRRMRYRAGDGLAQWSKLANTPENQKLLLYGLQRVARHDFDGARSAWTRLEARFSFPEDDVRKIERTLAFSAAQNHEPDALRQILNLDPQYTDDRLLEWGVRTALRDADWRTVLEVLDSMSNKSASRDEWQYWRARALEATGVVDQAAEIYQTLAQSRGFYNFLSADRLSLPYAYNHEAAVADDSMISQLEQNQGLIRARELFFVDLHGRARSEWDHHTAILPRLEQAQSAILADRWGWHSVAISTASRSGLKNDLSLRFPMAFKETFELNTLRYDLPTTWAFGIARSESLFMPDVSSSAGALGVMQLMPETGRLTARKARIKYRGRYSLLDPQVNIALGTFYLDDMYSRFGDHQVLATAAYNAGPHRVSRWLPGEKPIAADIWVETVPYTETRGYLRRVLAADVIFHWRLTGQTRRLAAVMPPVPTSAN